ncbi:hypothetical protein GIB67_010348 [Kingdonia uniflora]|uniref:Uncharacterized protein n=1 Tax=Kingdonia uniflora TaxID=39325 RepID=A0A7J7MAG8_9MAGN|nr:hypothetical protein GIB67_010348 [Kingdonia uniflora]
MPGLPQKNVSNGYYSSSCSVGATVSAYGIWAKQRDDISFDQLQKFWSNLSPHARQELLKIDKQTLLEQGRKNLYCSRCNGLLLEGFSQIVMYGKSLQQEDATAGGIYAPRSHYDSIYDLKPSNCHDHDTQDPSVHPWGGLIASRDGILTLLDCFQDAKSLKALQNVFDSARVRERERELLYPDACGGGGRGWISQGMANYGRVHGTRETCALHTARLSCDTLVDFWSALGDETRRSLLRMKEEDFIERLMYSCGEQMGSRALSSKDESGGRYYRRLFYGFSKEKKISVEDLIVWKPNADGIFTTKSAWETIRAHKPKFNWSKIVWAAENILRNAFIRFDSKRFCRDCRRNVIREFKELKELKRIRREPRCTSYFCVADTAFQYEVTVDTVQADWHQSFSETVGTYHHFEWAVGTGEGKSDILDFEDVGMNGSVQVNGLDLGGLSACFITLRAWKLDGRCTELSVKAHAMKGQPCVHRRLIVGDGYVTITKGESIRRFFEHAEEAEEEEDDESMDKDGNEMDGEGSRPQKHAKSPELAREFLLDAATVIFKEQVEKAFREGTARQNAHSIFVCLALKLLEERVLVACKEIITLEKQTKLLEEEEKEKREEEERKERKRSKEREKKMRRKERLKGKERDREDKCESNQNHADFNIEDHEELTTVSSEDSISETGDRSPDIQDEHSTNSWGYSEIQNTNNEHYDEEELCTREDFEDLKSSRWQPRYKKEIQSDQASKWCDEWQSVEEAHPRSYNGYTKNPSRCADGVNRESRNNSTKSNFRSFATKFDEKFHSCRDGPSPHFSTTRIGREIKTVNKSEYRSYGTPKSKFNSGNIHQTKQVWEPLDSRKKYPRSNSDSNVILSNRDESDNILKSGDSCLDKVLDYHQNPEDDIKAKESENLNNSKDSNSGPIMSSTSSSDNCSSCLSEGDTSTASSCVQNAESWSTSDSEDASQQSEGRDTSICDKSGGDKGAEGGGESSPVISSVINDLPIALGGSHLHQMTLPPMPNQSVHLPINPPSRMAYYHQSPGWPFSQQNHFLFATTATPLQPQHFWVQPLPTPVLNVGPLPTYHQPVNKANGVMKSKEQIEKPKIVGAREANSQNGISVKLQNGNSVKLQNGSSKNFSLFHFGGPMANGDFCPCPPADIISKMKETTMKEYSLFASNNGTRLSFF